MLCYFASAAILLLALNLKTVESNKDRQAEQTQTSGGQLANKPASDDRPVVPFPQIAPDVKSTEAFELYVGIKDVLDSLITSADSTEKADIIRLGQLHCEQQKLSFSGCEAFLDLLARYLDYKLALVGLDQQTADIQAGMAEVVYQLERIQALQREHFTDEQIAALFEQDWAFDEQAIARKQIALDPDLIREQKRYLIDSTLGPAATSTSRCICAFTADAPIGQA